MSKEEKKKIKIIAPVAIDFGAKKSGVYFAQYKAGSPLDKIQKSGEVLEYGNYTAMLKERTAARHVRRGYKRNSMAKRLVALVLKEHFNFPVEEHSQALGFLLNRRGFTFIDSDFEKEYLKKIPDFIWKELPQEAKTLLKKDNAYTSIEKCIDKDKIDDLINPLAKEPKNIAKKNIYYSIIKKLQVACTKRQNKENLEATGKDKLLKVSKWIVEELAESNIHFSNLDPKIYQYNMIEYLNKSSQRQIEKYTEALSKIDFPEEKDLKDSPWNFTIENFDLEKSKNILDKGKDGEVSKEDKKEYIKTYLHHLCYALYKIQDELESGGRHRKKYFEEIKEDLENLDKKGTDLYLQNFAQAIQKHSKLDMKKLYFILCHVSNLELKPLRAYFNDKTPITLRDANGELLKKRSYISHKEKDQFHLQKLSRLCSIWFLKHWRVNVEKDNEQIKKNYKILKEKWKNHPEQENIISFWLKTDPKLTIPPYQSRNNHQTPKCQSLILNEEYLNEHYPKWKEWLILFKQEDKTKNLLENYEEQLKLQKSNQEKQLISKGRLQARALQFLLDRSKKIDPFKLNEIWSTYHKKQQLEKENLAKEAKKEEEKLKEKISESSLPTDLKKDLIFEKEGSLGHFFNKYYQSRRKTKEGRYFLHQLTEKKDDKKNISYHIKKEKWDSTNKFFRICKHKPRQKKHQVLTDLASILGMNAKELNTKIKNTKFKTIEDFLKDIKGFQNNSSKVASMQKKYKGELKWKIVNTLKKEKDIEEHNKKQKLDKDEEDLCKLVDKCKELSLKLASKLWPECKNDKELKNKAKRFESIFSFAQIHNIVFGERHGFAKTCPVCSMDNAERAHTLNYGVDKKGNAKNTAQAARLNALSIRLIDGVVMRICQTLARHIASQIWNNVEIELKNGNSVCVPIVCEQNRFEFEPTLSKIKGPSQKKKTKIEAVTIKTNESIFNEKENRIKNDAQGISAYSGEKLGKGGEIDHIIPRASRYGTLNDEGNLIYVSNPDNQKKGNKFYYLKDLGKNYKEKIFKTSNDKDIRDQIHKKLFGEIFEEKVEEEVEFRFGSYLNFANLTKAEKTAFRHALFLNEGDIARKKVLEAIQNKNRTIVNGTQRYLAQCISDQIWRRAKEANKSSQISFDYFEYSAHPQVAKNTQGLRKHYAESYGNSGNQKDKERVEKPKKQPNYSHLLDAQMAFLLAVEDHKKEGTMGIKMPQNDSIYEAIDKKTGELFFTKYFEESEVGEENLKSIALSRKKLSSGVRLNRTFHRSTFYSENYASLLLGKTKDIFTVRAGFTWENSVALSLKKEESILLECLCFAKDEEIANWDRTEKSLENLYEAFSSKQKKDILYIHWNKRKIQEYFIENFSVIDFIKNPKEDLRVKFLRDISYRCVRKKIDSEEDITLVLNSKQISVQGEIKEKDYFQITIFKNKLILPVKKEWENLKNEWIKTGNASDIFNLKINDSFLKRKDNLEIGQNFKKWLKEEFFKIKKIKKHQKVRKVFSLPVVDTQGVFLQKRKSWNGEYIYQIQNDSDSQKDNNKFSRPILTTSGEVKEVINKPFISEKTFKLSIAKDKKKLYLDEDFIKINPEKWYEEKTLEFPKGINKVFFCITNNTRLSFRIELSNDFQKKYIKDILKNKFLKSRYPDKLKEKLKNAKENASIEYGGDTFDKNVVSLNMKS